LAGWAIIQSGIDRKRGMLVALLLRLLLGMQPLAADHSARRFLPPLMESLLSAFVAFTKLARSMGSMGFLSDASTSLVLCFGTPVFFFPVGSSAAMKWDVE
jgi:hypothetical protein